jgi:Flp pilus assembly protein TadD
MLPSDAQVAAAIGYILRRQGDFDGAVRYQWRAIELDPRNIELHLSMAGTMDNLRRYRTLDAIVERALVIDPRNPDAVAWKIGSLALLDGDFRRAGSYAAELSPELKEETPVGFSLAGIAWQAGDVAEATRIYDSVELRNPNDESVQVFGKGLIYHSAGDVEGSRRTGEAFMSMADELPGYSSMVSALASALKYDTAAVHAFAGKTNAEGQASPDHMLAPQIQGVAALALTMVGDQAGAADLLLHLATVPSDYPSLVDLEVGPSWAGFRASPEYPAVRAAYEAALAEGARLDAEAGF